MVMGAKVCELKDGFLWSVCGLYVGILMSPLSRYCLHARGGIISQYIGISTRQD